LKLPAMRAPKRANGPPVIPGGELSAELSSVRTSVELTVCP
jgi:hypothetical protein